MVYKMGQCNECNHNCNEFVRVILNLPADVVRVLRNLAVAQGRTMTDIIIRGILTEDFIFNLRMQGAELLVTEGYYRYKLVFN